jgi:vanillate O-demethylase monooxygenase subunit
MYPFKSDETMVRNRWYIAGYGDEISREPMERTILGKPVVFYRTEAGTAIAMYGICPHRYFPLADSTLDGDAIACGYHGFKFDADGTCVDVPSQDNAIKFCQPTYRVEERGPLCWIWMGDEDKCDPALIPPYEDFGLDQEGWHTGLFNYFRLEGRSQLLIDNLMDLTHLPYVHHHIPGGEHLAKTENRIDEDGDFFMLYRDSKVPFTPFHDLIYGPEASYEGLGQVENQTAWYGPELIRTGLGEFVDINGDPNVPAGLGLFYIMHGITPETETSTHYFGWHSRNFRLGDAKLDQIWLESDNVIRGQDKVAIDAVESRLESSVELQRELLVRADNPAVKIRRKVQAMLDAEADQPA